MRYDVLLRPHNTIPSSVVWSGNERWIMRKNDIIDFIKLHIIVSKLVEYFGSEA